MLTQDMLQTLAEPREGPCVSIYSPTHAAGQEAEGDPIYLKSALQKAEKVLKEREIDPGNIERIIRPAQDLQAAMSPGYFGDGALCCLLADGFDEIVHTPKQIEDQQVLISDRFHLKPLIPTLTDSAHFYVLAISRHHVRLLQCTRYTQQEEPLSTEDVPQHIADAIAEVDPERSLQFRTSKMRGSGRGDSAAMYHGHAAAERIEHDQVLQYFRQVNRGIVKYMNGRSPLIFAGVDELFHPYRQANSYKHLLDEPIRGNPEHLRPEDLREKAWEILQPHFEERLAQAQESFAAALAHGRATDDMAAVVLAARDGRVESFFGAVDEDYWGRVPELGDEVQMRAEPQPGDYDLIDYAAVETMLKSGSALLLPAEQVPGDSDRAAAILRY